MHFTLFILFLIHFSVAKFIDLGGKWQFFCRQNKSISATGQVPGDIYADLISNGFIKTDPLYGRGDDVYRWVSHQNWIYEKKFQFPDELHRANFVLLHLSGIDSPCTIRFNGEFLATMDNQFVSKSIDLWSKILPGSNLLRIEFESPVHVAKFRAEKYKILHGHQVTPECTPPVYNGECQVQFLRKMQASFSWDWGPSFPTVGIWAPIRLEYFDDLSIQQFSPLVQPSAENKEIFTITIRLSMICAIKHVTIEIKFLDMNKIYNLPTFCTPNWYLDFLKLDIPVGGPIKLWYPRGYGSQPTYPLEVQISAKNGSLLDRAQKRIAFRAIRLNQDLVNSSIPSQGRLFQFEVNGIPIFLKGTNWVPISMFPARDHRSRRDFLFHSMVAANMNVLRVWGGGLYETEEFYEKADELGLLIWQDFMFACALYPVDSAFLDSVKAEVEEQMLRLRHHPSILCWAGNNENELAVRTQWYPSSDYPLETQIQDYLVLYRNTVQPLASSLDPSRPFLLSSPSNGVETERQGGVSQNPGDPAFGDIHFYSETVNLWKAQNYLTPRCASEFGVQSMPLGGTMQRWLSPQDWRYSSKVLVGRQHHPGGVLALPMLVYQHFGISNSSTKIPAVYEDIFATVTHNNVSFSIDRFAFLSQIHQAVALQTQIEHYRRSKTALDPASGLGRTMCAMYWQLNDVWAAPTWSTVDFDLRWKIAHHFVARSFGQLIVSMFLDPLGHLRIFTVSDLLEPLQNVSIQLQIFDLQTVHLEPIDVQKIPVPEIPALTALEVNLLERKKIKQYTDEDVQFLVTAQIWREKVPLSPLSVLYPDKMYGAGQYGSAQLRDFHCPTAEYCKMTVSSTEDRLLPLVWLDLADNFKRTHPEVLYYFEENTFPVISASQNCTLHIVQNPKGVDFMQEDIITMVL